MYKIETTGRFEKDYLKSVKRNYDLSLLENAVELLENDGKLPRQYKAHKLAGNYINNWECHLKPDWLLIWQIDEKQKTIILVRTGTHSDLF